MGMGVEVAWRWWRGKEVRGPNKLCELDLARGGGHGERGGGLRLRVRLGSMRLGFMRLGFRVRV
jgi:hypothetical protein